MRLPLDHIGILGPDIETLVAEFRLLGFAVVGPAELTAIDDEGRSRGLGQFSAHVMFEDSYIELTAVTRPTPEHHLADFLQPPWGIRLLILGTPDIEASHAECAANGLRPGLVQRASRRIDYGAQGEARFRWFALPADDWPEALVAFAEHETPELVFQREVTGHANGARGMTQLVLVGESIPERFARLGGDSGTLLACVSPSAPEALGFPVADTAPLAAVGILVPDLQRVDALLAGSSFERRCVPGRISTRLSCGVCLCFEADAD